MGPCTSANKDALASTWVGAAARALAKLLPANSSWKRGAEEEESIDGALLSCNIAEWRFCWEGCPHFPATF